MWCPEGYKTFSQAKDAALAMTRRLLIAPNPADGDWAGQLGAASLAEAAANWLLRRLLWRDVWGVSSPDGAFMRLDLRPLLIVPSRPKQSTRGEGRSTSMYFNPISTIGPPDPLWVEILCHHWQSDFPALDLKGGYIRTPSALPYWKSLIISEAIFPFFTETWLRHRTEYRLQRQAFVLAKAFRNRAICIKASDLEDWVSQTETSIAAFMSAGPDAPTPYADNTTALDYVMQSVLEVYPEGKTESWAEVERKTGCSRRNIQRALAESGYQWWANSLGK